MADPSWLDYVNALLSAGAPGLLWAWMQRKNRRLEAGLAEANAYAERQEQRAERLEDQLRGMEHELHLRDVRDALRDVDSKMTRWVGEIYDGLCRKETRDIGVDVDLCPPDSDLGEAVFEAYQQNEAILPPDIVRYLGAFLIRVNQTAKDLLMEFAAEADPAGQADREALGFRMDAQLMSRGLLPPYKETHQLSTDLRAVRWKMMSLRGDINDEPNRNVYERRLQMLLQAAEPPPSTPSPSGP